MPTRKSKSYDKEMAYLTTKSQLYIRVTTSDEEYIQNFKVLWHLAGTATPTIHCLFQTDSKQKFIELFKPLVVKL